MQGLRRQNILWHNKEMESNQTKPNDFEKSNKKKKKIFKTAQNMHYREMFFFFSAQWKFEEIQDFQLQRQTCVFTRGWNYQIRHVPFKNRLLSYPSTQKHQKCLHDAGAERVFFCKDVLLYTRKRRKITASPLTKETKLLFSQGRNY